MKRPKQVVDFVRVVKAQYEESKSQYGKKKAVNPLKELDGVSTGFSYRVENMINSMLSSEPNENASIFLDKIQEFYQGGSIRIMHSTNSGKLFIQETQDIPFDQYLSVGMEAYSIN